MLEPSPFQVAEVVAPDAEEADLDRFLAEIDAALEAFVLAEDEHILLARRARTREPRAA